MQFLNSTTLEEIVGEKVTVIIRSNSQMVETITARAFLKDEKLFIDCIPIIPGKYITPVPDDAFISSADRPEKDWRYGIFIHPDSEAAKFIKSILDTKRIAQN